MWSQIGNCTRQSWSPTIGDPSVWGWSIVAAYALAAMLAYWVAGKRAMQGRERAFWFFLSVVMAILAVNKQLDLQSAITSMARCAARLQGWYDARREVQAAFILAVAGATMLMLLASLIALRRHLRRNWPAILGLCLILGYVAMRAAGFHHFDRMISTEIAGIVRVNPAVELTGILLVIANALWLLAHVRPPRRPGSGRGTRGRR